METKGLVSADLFQLDQHNQIIVKRSVLAQRIGQASECEDPNGPLAPQIVAAAPAEADCRP